MSAAMSVVAQDLFFTCCNAAPHEFQFTKFSTQHQWLLFQTLLHRKSSLQTSTAHCLSKGSKRWEASIWYTTYFNSFLTFLTALSNNGIMAHMLSPNHKTTYLQPTELLAQLVLETKELRNCPYSVALQTTNVSWEH